MVDVGLIVYMTAWYAGNYYYNIYNKLAAKAAGGATYAMTLATIQLIVGSLYALFLWVAPEARKKPTITFGQFMQLAPLGFATAAAHAGAVFAMSAGAVSFGQIVKAAEPVFAAGIGYVFYNSTQSKAKLMCLVPIVGGIWIASVEELDFTIAALLAASTANVASAFRGGENKKAQADPALKAAIGGSGNMYALSTLWATIMLVPLVFLSGEYEKFGDFKKLWDSDATLRWNTLLSGLTFYGYNEVSTLALQSISGVTHSVANTAKRAIIIVGCAIAFGESMAPTKMAGCSIAICGTFLYAIIDDLMKPKAKKA